MDIELLHSLLEKTTVSLRKGEAVTEKTEGNVSVTNVYFMPHVDESKGIEKVDMHFIVVGVNKLIAEGNKDEFIQIIKTYPNFARFREGLSYIEIGATIGSQEAALKMMALGDVLDLWTVMTPEMLGITGDVADDFAGRGFVMITDVKIT